MKVKYRGREIQIDEEDLYLLEKYTWSYTRYGYLKAEVEGKTQSLQKVILNCPDDMVSDHINRDINDYRRSNLRITTKSFNLQNQDKNAYDCYGVHPNGKGWRPHVQWHSKCKYLGTFKTKEEACYIRDRWAVRAYGKEANLNLPEKLDEHLRYWEERKEGK